MCSLPLWHWSPIVQRGPYSLAGKSTSFTVRRSLVCFQRGLLYLLVSHAKIERSHGCIPSTSLRKVCLEVSLYILFKLYFNCTSPIVQDTGRSPSCQIDWQFFFFNYNKIWTISMLNYSFQKIICTSNVLGSYLPNVMKCGWHLLMIWKAGPSSFCLTLDLSFSLEKSECTVMNAITKAPSYLDHQTLWPHSWVWCWVSTVDHWRTLKNDMTKVTV